MNEYGFTIKCNIYKEPTESSYEIVLNNIRKKGELLCMVYEDKTKGGRPTKLHIHGVCRLPRNIYFRFLCPDGYHTQFEQIYDISGWKRYMNKNNFKNDNDLINQELASPHINNSIYMFDT